jgi:hypothetical protein
MTTPFVPGQAYIGSKVDQAPQIFAGLVTMQQIPHSGGTAPKAALFASNSGTGAAIGAVTGYDMAGNFTITAGTSPTTGTVATVTFGRPLAATPVAVNVSGADTSGATNLSFGAMALSKTGFSVYASAAMTLNHAYLLSYQVWQ